MKTSISIDDELLRAADNAAQGMGVSRSRLFALAVDEFLEHRRQRAAPLRRCPKRCLQSERNWNKRCLPDHVESATRQCAR
jgi:hypothetical protein